METVNIALATDRNYLPHACTAIASMLVHRRNAGERDIGLNLYLLHRDLNEVDFEKLRELNAICAFRLIPVAIPASAFADWRIYRSNWTEAAYYRLILPSLLPDVSRIIYLDCDLLLLTDVLELWRIPLDSCRTGAVAVKVMPEHKIRLGLAAEDPYLNSGVMVFDLAAMRASGDEARFREIYETCMDKLKYPDQDILNIAYRGGYKLLPLKWNLTTSVYRNPVNEALYSEAETLDAIRHPGIAHFTGVHKPWRIGKTTHHPYSSYYWKYLKLTPFADEFRWRALVKKCFNGRVKRPKLRTPWSRKDINWTIPVVPR